MAGKKKKAKGSSSVLVKIPARRGAATHLRKGQKVKIVNTHGSQVVDFWASMLITRESLCRWSTVGSG